MNFPPEIVAEAVEEYADAPERDIPPRHDHECMRATVEYGEADFDFDPTVGISAHSRAHLIHTAVPRASCAPDAEQVYHGCVICGGGPITALSDQGYMDFSQMEEDIDEPEWCGLCWECARPIWYGEFNERDPLTGKRATDGLEEV